MTVDYVDAGDLARRFESSPDSLLGVISYSAALPARLTIPAAEASLQPLGGETFEVWSAPVPVVRSTEGSITFSDAGSFVFGVFQTSASDSLTTDALDAYNELLAFFARRGVRPVRMWNYFPRINEVLDIERYKSFCVGRSEAFTMARYDMFNELPAGSAIGSTSGQLLVYFVATKEKARFVENARQVSAFRYPDRYGPRSPSFARGAVIGDREQRLLFISGTASIVGHESIHPGDVAAQTEETIRNMSVVLQNGLGAKSFDGSLRTFLKVYVRHPADVQVIREIVDREIRASSALYVQGDICRRELLVEIEAVVAA